MQILAKGRSDFGMYTELIKLALLLVCVFSLNEKGIYVLCVARVVVSIVTCLISIVFARVVLQYNFFMLLGDMIKPLVGAAIMGIIAYSISLINLSQGLILFLQIIIGVCVYCLYSWFFMREDFNVIIRALKKNVE